MKYNCYIRREDIGGVTATGVVNPRPPHIRWKSGVFNFPRGPLHRRPHPGERWGPGGQGGGVGVGCVPLRGVVVPPPMAEWGTGEKEGRETKRRAPCCARAPPPDHQKKSLFLTHHVYFCSKRDPPPPKRKVFFDGFTPPDHFSTSRPKSSTPQDPTIGVFPATNDLSLINLSSFG